MVFIHLDRRAESLERRDTVPDSSSLMDEANRFFGIVCILFVAAILVSTFLFIRRYRARNVPELPLHKGHVEVISKHVRSLDTLSHQPSFVMREKEAFFASTSGPPPSTPPVIHLTLPEELDDGTKSGFARIVVVSIGEHGEVGLSPLAQEQLPPYQEYASDRFQSLDLDRLGGLKENKEK